jgi:hypothetical protein
MRLFVIRATTVAVCVLLAATSGLFLALAFADGEGTCCSQCAGCCGCIPVQGGYASIGGTQSMCARICRTPLALRSPLFASTDGSSQSIPIRVALKRLESLRS